MDNWGSRSAGVVELNVYRKKQTVSRGSLFTQTKGEKLRDLRGERFGNEKNEDALGSRIGACNELQPKRTGES